jgi:hypothetical protein
MDPGAVLSAARETLAQRRAELVARAASQRQAVAQKLAPLATIDRWLERIDHVRNHLPGIAAGAALGLSALLIAIPRNLPLVRTGVAAFQLAGSLRRLFRRRA